MPAAEIPRQSPDFLIQTTNGKQIKVSDYRGKVLCLAFILTTCPHCLKTTQLLEGMYPELAPKGFAVVEAALNENPDIPSFVSQNKVPWPVERLECSRRSIIFNGPRISVRWFLLWFSSIAKA